MIKIKFSTKKKVSFQIQYHLINIFKVLQIYKLY